MSGFFPDEELRNPQADEPWKKSETDRMLDLYFAGSHPKEIAHKLSRNPKAVKRRLEQFTYNERDRVIRYEPRKRVSRKGKRFTQNERLMWEEHVKRKVPPEVTAKVLQRDLSEITGGRNMDDIKKLGKMREVAPAIDVIWALRYIYLIWKTPVITDAEYDILVQEEIEFGGGSKSFESIKNHLGWPPHIKSLAFYLDQKYKDKKK